MKMFLTTGCVLRTAERDGDDANEDAFSVSVLFISTTDTARDLSSCIR